MPGSIASSSTASSISKPIKTIKTGCVSCPCGDDAECTCCFIPW